MPKRLSPELEREVRRLAAKGHGLREIGRMVKCSRHVVCHPIDSSTPTADPDGRARPETRSMSNTKSSNKNPARPSAFTNRIGRRTQPSRVAIPRSGRLAYLPYSWRSGIRGVPSSVASHDDQPGVRKRAAAMASAPPVMRRARLQVAHGSGHRGPYPWPAALRCVAMAASSARVDTASLAKT